LLRLGAAFALAAPLAGFGAALTGGTARADSSCGVFLAEGDVVALSGTPHVWVADRRGALHWGGDTRALADRVLNWGQRRDVTAAQLETLPVGDPWLSAGLLKIGDPIYLVKWESDAPTPTLLHVQSIADLELFGIDSRNYGAMVVEPAEWERRYGIATATLPRAELGAATTLTSEGYDANWACGADGWQGSSGWVASAGMMANDGTQPRSVVVAPFRPAGAAYAIEASMQYVDGAGRFGVVLGRNDAGWYGAGVGPRGARR
jgi:hypothetical protein